MLSNIQVEELCRKMSIPLHGVYFKSQLKDLGKIEYGKSYIINLESEVGEDQIDASYDGEELSIGFNISYIQDVIDTLTSDNIHVCINDQNSGCVLLGESEPSSVFVIMPMRV